MLLSRFWTLLLAILVAIMLCIVMLARDLVNRERQENAASSLYKELDKIEVAFTLHARKRLDILLTATADSDVRTLMAEISRDASKAAKNNQKLMTVLRERNQEMKQYAADMLLAVDSAGTVVVQVGKESTTGFNLKGFPTVDAALRGYVRDDVWRLGREVYLIAARPIIEGNRYVGALIHGMKLSDQFASEMSSNAQIAFFDSSLILALGRSKVEGAIQVQAPQVGRLLTDAVNSEPYKAKGRSELLRISTPEQDYLAVYSRIHGEAAENGVGWAIVSPVPKTIEITSFYEEAGEQDVAALPLYWIVAGLVLVVILGWLWNYLEAERPVSRLLKSVVALETADVKDQLNIYKFSRRVRRLAVAINKLMDLKMKSLVETNASSGRSVDAILGKQEIARLSSASFRFAELSSDDIPPPPPAALSAPPVGARPSTGGHPALGMPPVPGKGIPPTPPAGLRGSSGSHVMPPAPPASAGQELSAAEELAYFKQIHAEFVALKQKLGEPLEQLTYERFEVTLKKNRDALKARYGCKAVKFQVYEKDGKASLKATPVQ